MCSLRAAAFVDEALRLVGISGRDEVKGFSDERPDSEAAQRKLGRFFGGAAVELP